MPWRDPLDDAPARDFVRQLAVTPLADRSIGVGWRLTGQGDDLAHLLRRELRRRTTARRIHQPLGHADYLQWQAYPETRASAPANGQVFRHPGRANARSGSCSARRRPPAQCALARRAVDPWYTRAPSAPTQPFLAHSAQSREVVVTCQLHPPIRMLLHPIRPCSMPGSLPPEVY